MILGAGSFQNLQGEPLRKTGASGTSAPAKKRGVVRDSGWPVCNQRAKTQTQSIAGKNRNPAWRHTDSSDGIEADTFSDHAKQHRTVPRPDTAIEDDPMTELQRRSQQVREALQQTVARAMETTRRLGQYAVIFKDGKAVRVPPDKLGGVLN